MQIGKPNSMPILVASDHAGLTLKTALIEGLREYGWEDLGPSDSKSVDYPDYAQKLAQRISQATAQRGILICGSGVGMVIAANKVSGIRAALAENPITARLSREHNDANILCLGSRILAPEYGIEIVRVWLETPFTGGNRHVQRIQKLHALEK